MTVLGEAPTGERRAAVLELLLGANAFWVGAQGATLALDPALRQVLLMRKEPLAVLERRGLREVVGEIIAASERWAGELRGAAAPADDGTAEPGGASDPMIRV